jgi:hypothetical protein
VRAGWQCSWNEGRDAIAADPKLIEKLERIVLVQWKIRLLINPAESDHRQLYETIRVALERLKAEDTRDADSEADVEHITRLSQSILKREWERVKRGV